MPIPSIIAGWYHDQERPLVGNRIDPMNVGLWALADVQGTSIFCSVPGGCSCNVITHSPDVR